jgi:signal transduction histidine kinase
MTLNAGEFIAGEAIATACSIAQGHALRRGIRIEVSAGGAANLRADRQKVVQVLVNLLANAIRFSPEGAVVRVGLTVGARDVRFAVADRGAGVPREALDRIFEEFEQAPSAAGLTELGTGLGLALSRQLARLHGGDIQVESVFGLGSTFTLVLPRSILPDLALAV